MTSSTPTFAVSSGYTWNAGTWAANWQNSFLEAKNAYNLGDDIELDYIHAPGLNWSTLEADAIFVDIYGSSDMEMDQFSWDEGAIDEYVKNGGTLYFSDSDNFEGKWQKLPGGFDFDYKSEYQSNLDLSNLPDAGLNTGVYTFDNTSFDRGNSTTHGYISSDSIPDTSDFSVVAHYDDDPSKVGIFAYKYGDGFVVANTIPYSHYMSGDYNGIDDLFEAIVAHESGSIDISSLWGGLSPNTEPVPQPEPPAGENLFANQVAAAGDEDSSLIFTTKLIKADGQEVDKFKVTSFGTEADQSTKYILNVEVANNSGATLEGLDFTLNFSDSLFKDILNDHVSITENLDLANSIAIKEGGGAIRVMAGSAGNLTNGGSGIDTGSKSTVASFLLDINDSQFVDGLDGLDTAGIQITANLDQTVFGDLTTLRDRGGAEAFAIGSEDISVVMAEAQLDDVTSVSTQMGQDQNGFVLGTVRQTGVEDGVNDFSNLIRSGATLYKASSTWTNNGDITATDVKLTLNSETSDLDSGAVKLSINGSEQSDMDSTDFDLNDVSINDSITIDYAIKAIGDAGSVFSSADIGYEISAAGGKTFSSTTEYLDTSNLITYQGDLNLDGAVSMLDLAYLNSGALDEAKDTDADFNGVIDMEDLVFIDSDWGESLHTGDKKFTGSDSMTWDDLSRQFINDTEDGPSWTDKSFQNQNQIEIGDDFQEILGLMDLGEGNISITDDTFQDNDLGQADTNP